MTTFSSEINTVFVSPLAFERKRRQLFVVAISTKEEKTLNRKRL